MLQCDLSTKNYEMMKRWTYLFLAFLFLACKNEKFADQYAEQQEAVRAERVKVESSGSHSGEPSGTIVADSEQDRGETTAVRSVAMTTEAITLAVEQKSVKAGELACLKFSVGNFQGILSTQYTLSWDPAILSFQKMQNFGLPYMDEQDFGIPLAKQGKLTCVWIDDSLRGVSLPDGSVMYEICYRVNAAAAGKSSPVEFVQKPTPFESVNLEEKILGISPVNGGVTVE